MELSSDRVTFRALAPQDLPMLHEWLGRPHVAEWWGPAPSIADVEAEFLPMTGPTSSTRGFIALVGERPVGFMQSYGVMGSGGGWWEEETDPGARGIDQFIADPADLNHGLGANMVRTFVEQLFRDPTVTKVQTDPSPQNRRAIRSYMKAGFGVAGEVNTPDGRALLMVRKR